MKILFATTRFPYPPLKGDKVAAYNRIKCLSRRHEIVLLSFIESEKELDHLPKLAAYCSRVETVLLPRFRSYSNMAVGVLGRLPLQVLYYRSGRYREKLLQLVREIPVDLIHAVTARGAPHAAAAPHPVKILDMIDSLSLNMERRARRERGLQRWVFLHEARRMRRFERHVSGEFARALLVSEIDREHIGIPNAAVVPLGTELPNPRPPHRGSPPTVVFTGNLAYFPNRDAALFLGRKIYPALKRLVPEVRLKIIGPNMPPELTRLARELPGLELIGYLPHRADWWRNLQEATLAICPLRAGSGMQFKVLEAMACGLPVIVSRLALGDIAARPGVHLLVANQPEEFVSSALEVLRNEKLAQELGGNARRLVEDRYTWEKTTQQLENLYEQVIQEHRHSLSHAHRH